MHQHFKSRLNNAFSLMRKKGIIARQKFSCCNGCAGAQIATELDLKEANRIQKVTGACFYTKQDFSNFNERETRKLKRGDWSEDGLGLFLSYGPVSTSQHGSVGDSRVNVGRMVADCLSASGLSYEWDGNEDSRIFVNYR